MSPAGDIFRKNPHVEYRNLDEEGRLLIHRDTGVYHGLNDVGALIWELLDGVTLENLVARLQEHLVNAPATLHEEVGEFLSQLVERDLVFREPSSGQ